TSSSGGRSVTFAARDWRLAFGDRLFIRRSMTADAQLVEGALRPDLVSLGVAWVGGIAFASMARTTFCKNRRPGDWTALVMAGGAFGTRFGFVHEFRIRIQECFVWFVSEADQASNAFEIEFLDLRSGIVALGFLGFAIAFLRRLGGIQHARCHGRNQVQRENDEFQFHQQCQLRQELNVCRTKRNRPRTPEGCDLATSCTDGPLWPPPRDVRRPRATNIAHPRCFTD